MDSSRGDCNSPLYINTSNSYGEQFIVDGQKCPYSNKILPHHMKLDYLTPVIHFNYWIYQEYWLSVFREMVSSHEGQNTCHVIEMNT